MISIESIQIEKEKPWLNMALIFSVIFLSFTGMSVPFTPKWLFLFTTPTLLGIILFCIGKNNQQEFKRHQLYFKKLSKVDEKQIISMACMDGISEKSKKAIFKFINSRYPHWSLI
jgi:hypothetical protein